MNTSRDERRPKLFDERSIVKLNRGEGGSLFSYLRRYLSLILGGEGKIRCPAFSVKDVPFAPDENPRSFGLVRALAKLEKMDNAFTNKPTKNKALFLLL